MSNLGGRRITASPRPSSIGVTRIYSAKDSNMSRSFSFTSESVSEGHPDKVADQISDAVLDAILTSDPRGRVACETLVKTGVVIVAAELTTSPCVDVQALVPNTV